MAHSPLFYMLACFNSLMSLNHPCSHFIISMSFQLVCVWINFIVYFINPIFNLVEADQCVFGEIGRFWVMNSIDNNCNELKVDSLIEYSPMLVIFMPVISLDAT